MNTKTKQKRIWILLPMATAILSGCSLFGVRSYEEAAYTVISSQEPFEMRAYGETMVAETVVRDSTYAEAGRVSHERLFGYISGENVSELEISMTAPVIAKAETLPESGEEMEMTSTVVEKEGGNTWRYQFVLPKQYTEENAPLPLNPEVKLLSIPPKKVAAIRYSGSWNESLLNEKTDLLIGWIEDNNLTAISPPRSARYDPPWTLWFLRKNEVLVDVQ